MKIISILNNKGGVGKTTSAVNIAATLSQNGNKVLLIDLDSQSNATNYIGLSYPNSEGSYSILTGHGASVQATEYENLFIIPADIRLIELQTDINDNQLKYFLKDKTEIFDYVILDCPPQINSITINALVASNEVVIPVKLGKFDIDGFVQLFNVIDSVKKDYNPELNIAGVFITMYRNIKFYKSVKEELKKEVGNLLLETTISESVTVPRSQFEKKPLCIMSKKCKVSKEYENLVGELLCHI